MQLKIIKSPNYSKKSRKNESIKFVIIHYTGMQSKRVSLKRLTNPKSKVSCHYFIDRQGKIIQMVKDKNIAWHAGKSKCKKFKNLNKNSIGIELVNRGHGKKYENFSKPQIKNLITLCLVLKKRYKIKNYNFLGHSDIAPLRKADPGEKFPWLKLNKKKIGNGYLVAKKNLLKNINLKKKRKLFFKNLFKIGYRYFSKDRPSTNDKFLIKAFKRRYLPKKINGIIDKKTLIISYLLASEVKN